MKYCIDVLGSIIYSVEKGQSLKEIETLFPEVKHPRKKILRIINCVLGKEFLIKHAATLCYKPRKVTRKKPLSIKHLTRKIVPQTGDDSKVVAISNFNGPIGLRIEIDGLIAKYGFRQVLNALASHNSKVPSTAGR